jgi:hypothetical protein
MALRTSIVVFALLLSTKVFAHGYGTAGCGLGALVFGDDPGWMSQTAAATTNGTAYSQGFGITTGTSECVEDGKVAMMKAQEQFVLNNLRDLSKEMAQGEGETLRAFSQTFDCEEAAYGQFASTLKGSYRKVFAAPGAMAMLDAVRGEIASDEVLRTSCKVS